MTSLDPSTTGRDSTGWADFGDWGQHQPPGGAGLGAARTAGPARVLTRVLDEVAAAMDADDMEKARSLLGALLAGLRLR